MSLTSLRRRGNHLRQARREGLHQRGRGCRCVWIGCWAWLCCTASHSFVISAMVLTVSAAK
jgi:hypothetical protein